MSAHGLVGIFSRKDLKGGMLERMISSRFKDQGEI
jgi:hypothetical protein